MAATVERMEFKTELKQLMDIIIHALYSHPDIFLRELISNANDAIDKARFESLTKPEILDGDSEWKIKLIPDQGAGTLTVSDNGIGMSRETIVEDLGTIARSGTQTFLKNLKQQDVQDHPELIGQFGVGFYSAFMVADKVTVLSRRGGEDHGVKWESDGQGAFTVETIEKPRRGTDVILHMKEEGKEYLDPWRLREVVRKFSDFIEHPVVMDVEKEGETLDAEGKKNTVIEEELLNRRQAIWLRPKNDIKDEEYHEFYKHLTRHWDEPAKIIHYSAEGTIEFKALLFIPAERPMDWMLELERKSGLHLYIRRVFIMDDCEKLLPPWLRFVKGVVDAADLPLNVSREMIQENKQLDKIRKNLTGKVLAALADMKEHEPEKYLKVWRAFGVLIKEGVASDYENREKLADLLMAETTKTAAGELVGLNQVRDRMPEDQDAIYYLAGESRALLEASPALEVFKAKDWEVVLLTEPIDEWLAPSLPEFHGKKLKAADKGELPATEETDKAREAEAGFKDYLEYLKELLGDEVKDVRLSSRLKESASVLVSDEGAFGAHMERLMKKMGRADDLPAGKRILELNPEHATVKGLRELFTSDRNDQRLEMYGRLLYEEAVLAEGSSLRDPKGFMQRVNALMEQNLAKR